MYEIVPVFLCTQKAGIFFQLLILKMFGHNFRLRSWKNGTKNSWVPFSQIPQMLIFYYFIFSLYLHTHTTHTHTHNLFSEPFNSKLHRSSTVHNSHFFLPPTFTVAFYMHCSLPWYIVAVYLFLPNKYISVVSRHLLLQTISYTCIIWPRLSVCLDTFMKIELLGERVYTFYVLIDILNCSL